MKFSDYENNEDPQNDIAMKCHEIVFKGSDGNEEFLERISPESRLIYLTWCFDGEIHNGGFDHFFFNSIGDHSKEILNNLEGIGANISASLLKEAMSYFPNSLPSSDREKRWKELEKYEDDEKFEEHLGTLDDQFYEYEDNIAELLNKYARSKPNVAIKA